MVISESADRLVKSAERVQDLGEVLTPPETVKDMLDMLPSDTWVVHPSMRFFEPGCGDGNFLVEVLGRKLEQVGSMFERQLLPAGTDFEALEFHALETLSSMYGVDISAENVVGGGDISDMGARRRLLHGLICWYESVTGEALDEAGSFLTSATWIVQHNLLVGDLLRIDPSSPGGKNDIPLVEFEWYPDAFSVTVCRSSLAETLRNVVEERTGLLTLRLDDTANCWTVHPLKLQDVPIPLPRVPRRRVRNGNGWRDR